MAVFLAIALCVVLHPLAAASPPDPSWIPGIYDAADFDDAVVRVGLLASACDALHAPLLVPDAAVRELLLPADPPPVSRPLPPRAGRSPPIDRAA